MVRVALVEDDAADRQRLHEYLQQYERDSGERFRVTLFADGDEITEDYRADYDIILLDIEMTFVDGMTAAERIRQKDQEVVIIFITNMPQYVMKGYTVDALDYVLKPVSYYAFSQRIDRALARMKKRTKAYLTVPIHGGVQKVDLSELKYIEVQDHDLLYHLRRETIQTKGVLSEVEEQLREQPFFRCGKSYLINLEYVDRIQNNDVIIEETRIPISRQKRKALMDALNTYMNEVSK